jgi:hypothetical protein
VFLVSIPTLKLGLRDQHGCVPFQYATLGSESGGVAAESVSPNIA